MSAQGLIEVSKDAIVLAPNAKIVGTIGTKPIVKKVGRRTRGRSKKTIDRARKTASKIKIPVVKGTIVLAPIAFAAIKANEAVTGGRKANIFLREMTHSYTGMVFNATGNFVKLDLKRPIATWGGIVLLILDSQLGGTRRANQMLANANIPFLRL